jgi:hypothetical protein
LRVVNNARVIRNKGMIGRWATLGGFAALFGGLLYSCTSLPARMSGQEVPQSDLSLWVPWVGLVFGYLLISLGKEPWLRFAIRPRPDEALALNLKTLDNKSVLFNYVSAFPVEHLLLSPGGLVVIVTRPVLGDIVVAGERYKRRRGMFGWLQFVSEGALGNPGREALNGMQAVREYLAQRFGAEVSERVPIQAMVVFTHPRATVTLEEPTVPTTHVREVRNEVRRVTGQSRVPGDIARRLEYGLLEDASADGQPVNAGEAVDRKLRRRVSRPTRAR